MESERREDDSELDKFIRSNKREGLTYRLASIGLTAIGLCGAVSTADVVSHEKNFRQSYTARAYNSVLGEESTWLDIAIIASPVLAGISLPIIPKTLRASRKAYKIASHCEEYKNTN